ncbi:Hypothetical predicted protein [Cloeon dipterum]|uniref:Uncharacterized protein n=1 Tax=Cloeon dipterum TaxID=197152 RepID=A0A8S1DKT9_9INSE|nr:Hypothetical predicted protein [Cloeon dipterum]
MDNPCPEPHHQLHLQELKQRPFLPPVPDHLPPSSLGILENPGYMFFDNLQNYKIRKMSYFSYGHPASRGA